MTFVTNGAVGADLTSTTTDAKFALGDMATGNDGSEWVYCKASAAITQYHSVAATRAFLASGLTNTNAVTANFYGSAQIGFAQDEYGWICKRSATATLRVAASCAKNVALYTTATSGVIDDTATSIAFRLDGVQINTTNSAGGAASKPGIIIYPNIIVPA